jgi:hypothetical protein
MLIQHATDPTNANVAYALLDQKIAGMMHGRAYAWVSVMGDDDEWTAGVAVQGEPGYHPVSGPGLDFPTREKAEAFAAGMNLHLGLTEETAMAIIVTTLKEVW